MGIFEKEGYLKVDVSEEVLSDMEEFDKTLSRERLRKIVDEMRITFPPQKLNPKQINNIPFKEIDANMEFKTLTNLEILHRKKEMRLQKQRGANHLQGRIPGKNH